jgi:hypothetical protein
MANPRFVVQGDGAVQFLQGLFWLTRKAAMPPEVELEVVEWVELHGHATLGKRLREPSHRDEELRVPAVCIGVPVGLGR